MSDEGQMFVDDALVDDANLIVGQMIFKSS